VRRGRGRAWWRLSGVLVGSGLRAAPGLVVAVFALNFVARVALILSPLVLKSFVNAIVSHNGGLLAVDAVVIALFTGASVAGYTIGAILGYGVLNGKVDMHLTARVASLINQAPGVGHLERPEYAREIELLSEQRQLLAGGPNLVITLSTEVLRTLVMFAVLASVSPVLVLVPLLSFAPFGCDVLSTRYRARVDESLALDIRLANRLFAMTTTAAPAKELRVFGSSDALIRRHGELAGTIGRRTTTAGIVAGALSAAGWFVFAAGFAASIAFIVDRAVHGHATIGDVVLTVVLLQRAQFSAGQVAQAVAQLLTAARVARRLLWLEDKVSTPPTGTGEPPARLTDGIVFDHVTFAYPGSDAVVLDDLSVRLPAGAAVAVVGENGAGKTTLAKLLSRMYEPGSGAITVDGARLDGLDIHAWRERTTATFQDFARYELRAGHTVGIGHLPNHDDDAMVLAALDRAGAAHVVDALDDGLGTLLGRSFDGGRELSGGQWQNLALGRGQMRVDPLLLVLDEPTASLDAPTEHALFEHYLTATAEVRQRSGAITIIVSHRFSTVRRADLIVVLDHGRIAEQGSHDELLAAGGLYAELFTLQASAYR